MLNRNDDQNEIKKMVLLCVVAASMVLLLFLVTLYLHDNKDSRKYVTKEIEVPESDEKQIEVGKSNLVSEDLDFWDMYDHDEKKPIEDIRDDEDKKDAEREKKIKEAKEALEAKKNEKDTKDSSNDKSMNNKDKAEKDKMDDGKHVKVIGEDGKPAWYEILENVDKNKYDFENYLAYDNGLLKYNSSNVKTIVGIDISSNVGNIDFQKVKDAGVDYVMIKVAARGYESGIVTIDEKFIEYANGATAVGLPIGMIFSSQAITDVEAVEEANFAVAASTNYSVKFPIAIELSNTSNDKARTSKLTSAERTAIVKKFCETVKAFGKLPAVFATRDSYIRDLDLSDLSEYDIWLKDEAVTADSMRTKRSSNEEQEQNDNNDKKDTRDNNDRKDDNDSDDNSSSNDDTSEEVLDYIGTDFPYDFEMWQYTEKGTINGIAGNVNLNMSFVNYVER